MIKVFIGGSRRVTRLNGLVRRRLDEIVKEQLPVLIGDANGADKAVQEYFHSLRYDRVEVFCSEGHCRNNVGGWSMRAVAVPHGNKKGFEYYAAKDRRMAEEASVGFMLWDGRSRGTLGNIVRLIEQGKKVVTYLAPLKEFKTLRNAGDLEQLLAAATTDARLQVARRKALSEAPVRTARQHGLF